MVQLEVIHHVMRHGLVYTYMRSMYGTVYRESIGVSERMLWHNKMDEVIQNNYSYSHLYS